MATTQTVSPSFHSSKSLSVVSIPKLSPQAITQTELVLFLSLSGRFKQLEKQLEAADEDLKARLEASAEVQPGDHMAELKESFRRNVAWRGVAADLANTVFGSGNGETYCEEVLVSTKPTRSLSLIVE